MLYQVLKHIRNFFPDIVQEGDFTIENGTISLPFLLEGQYFLIEGSILNDGVYEYPAETLKNESFNGKITSLKIPNELLTTVTEIENFCEKNKLESTYQSESFGGYSYSRVTNGNGGLADWTDVFRSRLNQWRKI